MHCAGFKAHFDADIMCDRKAGAHCGAEEAIDSVSGAEQQAVGGIYEEGKSHLLCCIFIRFI